ncbi:20198_t:CDS:2 [Entrophospora sp. SA101]|nr:20198_t:CDS:2 [Entrophospora sp. SA101]
MAIHIPPNSGVDLAGAFVHEDEKYVLVVQCKHAKTYPCVVRDLRGVMAIYPDYTSIGILVINSEHDISNRMREEAELSSSNIIISDEISIYNDLTRFLGHLKLQKTLRHLREKEALREEIGEDIEKEMWKKVMDEMKEIYLDQKSVWKSVKQFLFSLKHSGTLHNIQ